MIRPWPPQDPQANLDYWFDVNPAITDQGSALASYEITITGDDDALTKTGEVLSSGVVYFWLANPTEGVRYTVTIHFELANGFEDDWSRTVDGEQQ